MVSRFVKGNSDGLPDTDRDELNDVAERISAAERRAMAAERDTIDRLIAAHLADRVGAVFAARISGVTRAGLFVKLADTGADGFVPAAKLGDEYFRYEETMHALVGSRSGEVLRLGDAVSVRLAEAAPFAGALRFDLVREGAAEQRGRGVRSSHASRRNRL